MEAAKTKELIQNAIEVETENARRTWGPRYNSEHEAYGVLKEEVEEAADDLRIIQEVWSGFINTAFIYYLFNWEQILILSANNIQYPPRKYQIKKAFFLKNNLQKIIVYRKNALLL